MWQTTLRWLVMLAWGLALAACGFPGTSGPNGYLAVGPTQIDWLYPWHAGAATWIMCDKGSGCQPYPVTVQEQNGVVTITGLAPLGNSITGEITPGGVLAFKYEGLAMSLVPPSTFAQDQLAMFGHQVVSPTPAVPQSGSSAAASNPSQSQPPRIASSGSAAACALIAGNPPSAQDRSYLLNQGYTPQCQAAQVMLNDEQHINVWVAYPTVSADGGGQRLFFFLGGSLVTPVLPSGRHASMVSTGGIVRISMTKAGTLTVFYAHYLPGNYMADPTGQPIPITYTWSGTEVVASGNAPQTMG